MRQLPAERVAQGEYTSSVTLRAHLKVHLCGKICVFSRWCLHSRSGVTTNNLANSTQSNSTCAWCYITRGMRGRLLNPETTPASRGEKSTCCHAGPVEILPGAVMARTCLSGLPYCTGTACPCSCALRASTAAAPWAMPQRGAGVPVTHAHMKAPSPAWIAACFHACVSTQEQG